MKCLSCILCAVRWQVVLGFVDKPILVMIPKAVFVVIVTIKLMMTENGSFVILNFKKYPRVCD